MCTNGLGFSSASKNCSHLKTEWSEVGWRVEKTDDIELCNSAEIGGFLFKIHFYQNVYY